MDWREWGDALRRRIKADAADMALTDRVEAAIEVGAKWIAEQAVISPKSAGLCLEFVSKHIIRRVGHQAEQEFDKQAKQRIPVRRGGKKSFGFSPKSITPSSDLERLKFLSALFEKLQQKGIDASGVSVKLLEALAGGRDDRSSSQRQPRSWYRPAKERGRG